MLDEPANDLINQRTGAALKELRRALGITQQQLAERVSASRSLIAQFETGRLPLSDDRFRDIAKALLAAMGEEPADRPSPSVQYAARVISAAARGIEEDDERYDAVFLIGYDETIKAYKRLAAQWTVGDGVVSPDVVAPLAGFCLAYPDVEVGVIVNLMGVGGRDRRTEAINVAVASHLLYAVFLAHVVLSAFPGGSKIIPARFSEVVRQLPEPGRRETLLRLVRGVADETVLGVPEGTGPAFSLFVTGLVNTVQGNGQ